VGQAERFDKTRTQGRGEVGSGDDLDHATQHDRVDVAVRDSCAGFE
jgi:hypothetical protein